MQKRKIKGLDHYATSEQERAQTTAKAGQRRYSMKSGKGSSQSRKRGKGGRAGEGRRRQGGRQDTAYKLAELLPEDTLKKLKELKR